MSLAHEVGHLFGCEHDDMNVLKLPNLNKDFEYGFYVDHPASHNLHTLMAWVLFLYNSVSKNILKSILDTVYWDFQFLKELARMQLGKFCIVLFYVWGS